MATYEQQLVLAELREKTKRVLSSRHGLWLENLSRWFEIIDSDATARNAVHKLESSVDFDAWHKDHSDVFAQSDFFERKGKQVRFPRDRKQSLGIRLRMFRAILDDKFNTSEFGLHFLGVFRDQDIVTAFSQDIFSPMVDDLDNYLTEYFESPDKIIPASDRIVPLDHNSADYRETIKAAEEFREELIRTNIDLEDKGRVVAEISAGIELLKAPSVDTGALKATLVKGAKYVADKAAGAIITTSAVALLGLIARLVGLI